MYKLAGFVKRNNGAFSLVEVVLALGVISFSMVSVIGVIPVGMSNMRSAADATTEGQILREMGAKISLTSFSKLQTAYGAGKFYFNESGEEQVDSSGAPLEDNNTRFRATTSIVAPVYPSIQSTVGNVDLSAQYTLVKLILVTSATKNAITKQTKIVSIPVANLGT